MTIALSSIRGIGGLEAVVGVGKPPIEKYVQIPLRVIVVP